MTTPPELARTSRRARRAETVPAPEQDGAPRRRFALLRQSAGRRTERLRTERLRTERLRAVAADWLTLARPVLDPARSVLRCISGLGRLVLVSAVLAAVLGDRLDWVELTYASWVLAILLALAGLLTIGRTTLRVTVRVQPQRVVAGEAAATEVTVTNVGRAPMLPVPLDLPTGETVTRFNLPALAAGATYEDVVVMPSNRRGVFVVGPAKTLRGDPFGLVRREVTWTEPVEFFVHPRTVYLASLGSGLLKDLEGVSSNEVSMSDLAFHALREYATGDDRRHIHWLSSAKRSGASGSDEFMVRQFLDTRRSHIGVLVDTDERVWVDPQEFETAVAAGSSVVMRALLDGMDISEAAGPYLLTQPKRHTALDLFSRARIGQEHLTSVAAQLNRRSSNISSVVMFTGPLASFHELRAAAAVFSVDATTVAVRVEQGAPISLSRSGGLTVVTIGALADLPRALAGRLAA